MFFRIAALFLLVSGLVGAQSTSLVSSSEFSGGDSPEEAAEAPPPLTCPAGGPIGPVDLRVQSPERQQPLPFRTINHLTEGDTVFYKPILRGKQKRHGEVALVLVPARRRKNEEALIVTDPKDAAKPQEWKMPETISLAAFVYSAEGLSKKKVRGFLSQDDLLIAQLADYAEKTSQTEALLEALSSGDSSSASVSAAVSGFASQYGLATTAIDHTAPTAAQAQALFSALNPQLASYDPLTTPSTSARVSQTASVMTAVAGLFFGNPVGLAAGGTAMLLDLRSLAFPGTQFRSSFAQSMPNEGLNLCGPRTPAPAHTRVAYIWAVRIPNTPVPTIEVGDASYIPASQKSPVPVSVPNPDWKYLNRARDWTLQGKNGVKVPISVVRLANPKALEIDLSKATINPGDYYLSGYWDWTPFTAVGTVHVRDLDNFRTAKLEPVSQDKLVAGTGKVPVTLTGDDFEFVTKMELKRAHDEFATAEPVRFILPRGPREGPQEHIDAQIDTSTLDPGRYNLLIQQEDGKDHPVPIIVLPKASKIENLPIIANRGGADQHFTLKGQHLELLTKLETTGATLELASGTPDSTERNVTVQLKSGLPAGKVLPVKAYMKDRYEPLLLPDALRITGPLPVIASSKLSLPANLAIPVHEGEFPAGYTLSAMLDVKNIEPRSVLKLGCADDGSARAKLHVGEQTGTSSLSQLSEDQLFVSFDTTSWPAGCSIEARLDNGSGGQSAPYTLAHIIRLPQIDGLKITHELNPNDTYQSSLTGRNLEMIEQVGWDGGLGVEVQALPTPIPGEGQEQSLQISLPEPPNAQAVLHVWLRGEKLGRPTLMLASNGGWQPPKPKVIPPAPPPPAPSPAKTEPAAPEPTPASADKSAPTATPSVAPSTVAPPMLASPAVTSPAASAPPPPPQSTAPSVGGTKSTAPPPAGK